MDQPITNVELKKLLRSGTLRGHEVSALLKAYYKNPIRVNDVTSTENRDKLECGNSAVIISEKIKYDSDMTTKELDQQVEFWEGLQI